MKAPGTVPLGDSTFLVYDGITYRLRQTDGATPPLCVRTSLSSFPSQVLALHAFVKCEAEWGEWEAA